MKTIYNAVLERLKEKVPALKWIDWDTAQLDAQTERPPVRLPCALIGIGVSRAKNLTDTTQECEATITVRLAFERTDRTGSDAPEAAREQGLKPYDVIADAYAALQGFSTAYFDPLTRISQAKENSRGGLFIYRITFKTEFEDLTADE